MKLGNENGEDCETSIVSLPAYMVISLAGWSLNAEMVDFDRNAPVRFELGLDLGVDVAVGPDDEVDLVHLGLGRYRPGSGGLRESIASPSSGHPGGGHEKFAPTQAARGRKFPVHAKAPDFLLPETLLRRRPPCQPCSARLHEGNRVRSGGSGWPVSEKGLNTEDDRGPLRTTEVNYVGRTAPRILSPWPSVALDRSPC